MPTTKRSNRSKYLDINARHMKPTRRHRPAIFECMLGTIYAMNEDGKTRYFDYDWDEAYKWLGLKKGDNPDFDCRTWRKTKDFNYDYGNGRRNNTEPRFNQRVLWVIWPKHRN